MSTDLAHSPQASDPERDRLLREEALRESETRFRSLFEAAGVGMSMADAEGRLVAVNGALQEMLGYPAEELTALGAAGVTHPDDMAADLELYGELIAGRRSSYTIEKRYLRADGGMLWGRLTVSLVRGAEGEARYAVGLLEDVTERRRVEEERRFLAEASRVLAGSLELEATLHSVARLAVPGLADWCAVDLLAPDGTLRRVAVEHPDPALAAEIRRIHELYPPGAADPRGVWKALHGGRPELFTELDDDALAGYAADAEHLRLLRALGIRSVLVVPLAVRGEPLGALTLVHAGSGRRFAARDLELARDLAGRAAVAIDNARLFTATEEARQQLEQQALEMEVQGVELEEAQTELEAANHELREANRALRAAAEAREEARRAAEVQGRRSAFLAEASRLLADSLEYRSTLANLAAASVPGLGDWCAVDMLDDPSSDAWPPRVHRLAVAHQDPARVAWARELESTAPRDWSVPTGLPQVLRSGKAQFHPVVTDEMLRAAAKSEEELARLREIGFAAYLCVPLVARGRVLGALTLCTTESGRHYDAADLALAEELAHRAAVAVDNARLYAAEQAARAAAERAADRLARLQRVTAALSGAVSSERVARVVAEEGAAALGAVAGVFARLDEEGAALELVHAQGVPAELVERFRSFPVAAALPLSDAVREGRPVYVSSPDERRELYPELAAAYPVAPQQAWAHLPLALDGRTLGAMTLSFAEPHAFDAAERAYIELLAQQCAQALDRSRLYEAERRARARAEAEARWSATLARVSSLLASSLDVGETVRHVGEVVVPELADLVQVYLLEGGRLVRVASTCADPARRPLVEALDRRGVLRLDGDLPQAVAIRTGEPQLLPWVDDEEYRRVAEDEEHLRLLRGIGARSVVVLPLPARGAPIGAIALGRFDAERAFRREDLGLAGELARRVALGLDNARLFEAEQRARTDAEAASRAKSEFLAVMSHELRTPLNAVLGYLDLLDAGVAGPLTEEQDRYLARVTASGKHLLGLIEEILTFSRLDADREEAAWEVVPAAEVARQAAELVEPLARARGLGFRVDTEGVGGAELRTDPGKLRQVLVNLLGNAVKFTDAGEVVLSASLAPGGAVRYAVRDTGIGIPADVRERIFEPFWQAAQGRTRRVGGTGLGLAVARELARLLGGEVTVESEPGAGSVFTVAVPASPAGP
ncbi:MAG: GAF domain-containing protein [Longimicrobiaceae bacterium]